MKQKLMIIEDNMVTARQISTFLGNDGYETKVYLDGESALADFTSYSPDLVLLDYFLPGMNAPEVCISIRKISDTPMIVLSGNTQTSDKIRMLELGADDYIEKPFDPDELKARIHAVLRRYHPEMNFGSPDDAIGDYVEYPGLFISQTSYTVKLDGKPLALPPKELELLYCLAASPNRVFTREQLLDYVWGYDYMGDTNVVDVYIRYLRQKLDDRFDEKYIYTMRGVGYVIKD